MSKCNIILMKAFAKSRARSSVILSSCLIRESLQPNKTSTLCPSLQQLGKKAAAELGVNHPTLCKLMEKQ